MAQTSKKSRHRWLRCRKSYQEMLKKHKEEILSKKTMNWLANQGGSHGLFAK